MRKNSENKEPPFVSIIVDTYNSGKFVLETLESVKGQKYKNIELIVTDDCSTDDTVDICRKWIAKNNQRFRRTELITTDTNTGIPANLNRGLKTAKGVWVKTIDGDDILTEDCISELISYILTQPEDIRILSSDQIKFSGGFILKGDIMRNPNIWFCSKESSAQDQYQLLLRANRVFGSTVIIRRDLLETLNGFDERFRLLDDWPMWVKITSKGYKIYHLDKATIFYRLHGNNLTQTASRSYIYHPVYKTDISFREVELVHRLPFIERLGLKHRILGIKICFFLGNDKKILSRKLFLSYLNFLILSVYI